MDPGQSIRDLFPLTDVDKLDHLQRKTNKTLETKLVEGMGSSEEKKRRLRGTWPFSAISPSAGLPDIREEFFITSGIPMNLEQILISPHHFILSVFTYFSSLLDTFSHQGV